MKFEWLAVTRSLQEQSYGVDYELLASDPEARSEYMRYNLLAAYDELGEVTREVGWKPWSRTRGWINRQNLIDECVDLMHFVGNLLAVADVSDTEFAVAYLTKVEENSVRMDTGYEQRGNENAPVDGD